MSGSGRYAFSGAECKAYQAALGEQHPSRALREVTSARSARRRAPGNPKDAPRPGAFWGGITVRYSFSHALIRAPRVWAKASIALAVLVVSGAAVALPAAASTGSPVPSKDIAGYSVTGRLFRYVQATVTVPNNSQCKQVFANLSPSGFGFAVTLGPAEFSDSGAGVGTQNASTVGISTVPTATGCGLWSPSFASNVGTAPQFGAGDISIYPGNVVTMSLYYNGKGLTQAVVRNNSTGEYAKENLTGHTATYKSASATGGFGALGSGGNLGTLWFARGLRLTTYSVQHGTFSSLGVSHEVFMTRNGGWGGVVLAYPTNLRNSSTNGNNFGVLAHYGN